MRSQIILVAASLFLALATALVADTTTPTAVSDTDEKMEAAIQEARSRVDEFITALESEDKKRYLRLSVKAPFVDGEHTEHLWLSDLSHKDGKFTGKIINEPHMLKTVKRDDEVTVAKTEISDWIYADTEKRAVIGGFTDKAMDSPAEHPLIGNWEIQSVDAGTGPRKQAGSSLEFTHNALFMIAGEKRSKMADLSQINDSVLPKQIDFVRGETAGFGVYELKGDTLTLSMRNPGEKRPTSLQASRGGMVFQLVRKAE